MISRSVSDPDRFRTLVTLQMMELEFGDLLLSSDRVHDLKATIAVSIEESLLDELDERRGRRRVRT